MLFYPHDVSQHFCVLFQDVPAPGSLFFGKGKKQVKWMQTLPDTDGEA